jgi:hypothetical protein
MSMNFVPCVAWVRKGIAKPVPEKVQLSPEELKTLIESTKEELGWVILSVDTVFLVTMSTKKRDVQIL